MHVPEVDHAHHRVRLCPRAGDERVPVVAVAVDHGAAQPRQRGHDGRFVQVEEPPGERLAQRVRDLRQPVADPARSRQVPLQLAVGGGVLEAGQSAVHPSEDLPEALVQLAGPRARLGERHAVDPGQEEREPRATREVADTRERLAAERGNDARQLERRGVPREVAQGLRLQRDEGGAALPVHDLQHEAAAVPAVEAEVVVVLAGQRCRRAGDAEALARDALRDLRRGGRGRILDHRAAHRGAGASPTSAPGSIASTRARMRRRRSSTTRWRQPHT